MRGHGYRGGRNVLKGICRHEEARLPMAPYLPWAGTLTEKGLPPSAKLEPSFCFSYASARAACQVAADVATRDRWPHEERNVEPVAAVRMVALGCAHDQGMGRGSACGGRIQLTRNIAMASL